MKKTLKNDYTQGSMLAIDLKRLGFVTEKAEDGHYILRHGAKEEVKIEIKPSKEWVLYLSEQKQDYIISDLDDVMQLRIVLEEENII